MSADHWMTQAIPQQDEPRELTELDWVQLERESKIVRLASTDRIQLDPVYSRWGLEGASTEMFLRASLWSRLQSLSKKLPDSMGLLIFDAYRSPKTQAALFDWVVKDLKGRYPDWDDVRIDAECALYVNRPGQASKYTVSPHLSGGAVDLGLMDLEAGLLLDHGTDFDEPIALSHTAALEDAMVEDWAPVRLKLARDHRRILYYAMRAHGFTNYRREWWHFDLGDDPWAKVHGTDAVYGAAEAEVARFRWD